mgnify:CR=1 FL=1
MHRRLKKLSLPALFLGSAVLAAIVVGCNQVTVPEGCAVINGFELERYLGAWYEIARLENRFERGLTQVSARYEKRADGAVSVCNRGFRLSSGAWEEARGVARFVGQPTEGRLKVSFFGPFYAGYNIIAIDATGYQWAMVAGPTRKYLWILARHKTLPPDVMARLIEQARAQGFDVEKLVRVAHDESLPVATPPASQGSPSPMVAP